MLKRALFAGAILVIPAIFMQGPVTPASAGPNNLKMKIAPKPRIRVVNPKVRLRIDTKRLAKRKKDDTQESAARAADAEQTVRKKDGVSLGIAGAGPQPEPPTTPSLPRRNPDRTGAVDAGRLAEINDAADTWQMIGMLEEMSRYDEFGQEQEPGPGNDDGLPGDTLAGLPGDLPDGAKPLETEGAPDRASYFNQGVPQPETSGNPPAGGGPSPGPTGERPGSGQVDGTTRQHVPDPRGMASDGTDSDEFNEDGSGSRTVHNDDGTYTVTQYDKDGNVTTESDFGAEDQIFDLRNYDSNGNITYDAEFYYAPNGTWISFRTDYKTGITTLTVRGRPVRPDQPGVEPTPQELVKAQEWICATMPWKCRPGHQPSPDEMLGQPDDPGNEGGARGTGGVTRLGREAVTNTGDSSFDTGRGATPHSPSAGSGPVGDPLRGGCPNCQDG